MESKNSDRTLDRLFRNRFAEAALTGLLASMADAGQCLGGVGGDSRRERVVKEAWKLADEMVAADE